MEKTNIGVYIKVNEDNYITEIHSEIFIKDFAGWIKIDEGVGDRYALAKSMYLEKYLIDDDGNYNYKYINDRVVDVSSEV